MAKRQRKPKVSPAIERVVDAVMGAMTQNPDEFSFAELSEVLRTAVKTAMERMMGVELTSCLGYEKSSQGEKPTTNRRNGTSRKTVRSKSGPIQLEIPRDRQGEFESRLIPKYRRDLGEIEDKVISLYAHGMSERDIAEMIAELYGCSLSATTISEMTDAVLPLVREWRARPLHKVYPFVFIDALYVDMKVERTSQKRAIYVMIGIDGEGRKDVLGFWNKASEGADEWIKIFDEIRARGVEKICFLSADGLPGIQKAVQASFGHGTLFQRCIVHMIRNSLTYLPRSDYAAFCSDIKSVYAAVSLDAALEAFERFKAKWEPGHPRATKVWTSQFQHVRQLFDYPREIRHVIYTTNTIESVNAALRKVTNLKGALPNEDALDKLLYLRIQELIKKWKRSIQLWATIAAQLDICCPDWREPAMAGG